MTRFRSISAWTVMALGALTVILFSLRYFTFDPEVYFEAQRATYQAHEAGLMIHIAAMMFALAAGPLQFIGAIRRRQPGIHRTIGKVYVTAAIIGGLSGIYMSLFTRSGAWSGIAFALLGIGVLLTTTKAFTEIRHRRVASHRAWITRSFALIFAAVTLRTYLPISGALGIDEYIAYAVIAWACWVPNLIVAEWLIRRQGRLPAAAAVPSLALISVGTQSVLAAKGNTNP